MSIRPGDATGTPGASNINFGAGGPNIANSVTVQLPTSGPAAGVIDIFVNGTAGEVLIDVAGFYQSATTGAPTAFNTSRGDFPGGAIGIDENGCVVGTNPTPIDPCVIAELEVAPGSYSVFGKLTAAATSDFANRELSCTVTYRPKGSAQLAETADDASVTTFEDQTINLALHGVVIDVTQTTTVRLTCEASEDAANPSDIFTLTNVRFTASAVSLVPQ